MKKVSLFLFCTCVLLTTSCKKKQVNVCYCSYLSGDKKEFNLTDLTRNQAVDSCNVLDHYASAFAGSCKLK
ncbi:MAG: V-type synthase subunit [Flavipsychrobacter sp.]|nr:V-type synthase subunit [Flavipsychrobacter sp.]